MGDNGDFFASVKCDLYLILPVIINGLPDIVLSSDHYLVIFVPDLPSSA